MRRFALIAAAVAPFVLLTAACDDPLGLQEAVIDRDTMLTLAAPTADTTLATALDFAQGIILRNPERVEDAANWDFALRQSGGAVRLIPQPIELRSRRPLLARSSDAFSEIERAPTGRSAYGDTAVTLVPGDVYIFRSRQYPTNFGLCYNYGKFRVLAVNAARGTATFSIAANVGCADERLEAD